MNVIATQEQKKARLDICAACPDKKTIMSIEVCGLCNCPLGGKTSLVFSTCPAKPPKWIPLAKLPGMPTP